MSPVYGLVLPACLPVRQAARRLRRRGSLRSVLLVALVLVGRLLRAEPPSEAVGLPADQTVLATPTTGEADLIRRLGPAWVRRADIAIDEGETEPGTLLFADDPSRRLEILWRDPDRRAAPAALFVRVPRSAWHIPHGIGIGTDLKTLEGWNGRPFGLAGFDLDPQLGCKRYAATERSPHQRLSAAAGVRSRAAPDPSAAIVATVPIGTPLTLTGEGTARLRIGELEGPWYPVRSDAAAFGAGVSGWVFGPLTLSIDPAAPDVAYGTLLEARLAASGPQPLADDLELLRFIASHLTADGPNDAVRAGAGPVVERIDGDLRRACRFDLGLSGTVDFRAFGAEIRAKLGTWEGRDPTEAGSGQPEEALARIETMIQDCAALALRTRFEQEALGGIAVGVSGRQVEAVSRCRFRRWPPEASDIGDTFVRWQSSGCGLDLRIVVGEDKDALAGSVTNIVLTRGFAGRSRDSIGIGSTRAEVLAAYGRYFADDEALGAFGSGNWVCDEGASVRFQMERDRVSAIELGWGFCD